MIKWLLHFTIIRQISTLWINALAGLGDFGHQHLGFLAPLRSWWRGLTEFWRDFNTNIVIGLVIGLLLHFFHGASWIQSTENMAMDVIMVMSQGSENMSGAKQPEKPLLLTWIDIDEETYRQWDEPLLTPRAKLVELIRYAQQGGAKAVLVDIDLADPFLPEQDQQLIELLSPANQQGQPPIFLPRTFHGPSSFTNHSDRYVRKSFLDDQELADNIHWVEPIYKLSAEDSVLRHWQLFRFGCQQGKPQAIPSFQLLVDASLRGPEHVKALQSELQALAPEDCNQLAEAEAQLHASVQYANREIQLNTHGVGERLIYTIPYSDEIQDDFHRVSASSITEESVPASFEVVKDRVVVIGGSYSASRDVYRTPLGQMPGALVVVNATKSLHLFGQIEPPHALVKWLIEIVLIVLMSWAYARFTSLRATVLSGATIVILLVPFSFYFFKFGLWVDFAVPLIGMQFHQLIAEYEESEKLEHQLKALREKYGETDA